MSEPLTAVVTRDGNRWTATVDIVGDVSAATLVELTYAAHAAAIEAAGKPQAIDFKMPYGKEREQVRTAAAEAQAATDRATTIRRQLVKRLIEDRVGPDDTAVLLGVDIQTVRVDRRAL